MISACVGSVSHAATIDSKRPPLDSFLKVRVDTVNQLVDQVSTNANVRAHYAKVFNIPESSVVSYFKSNLVESYVSSPKTYPVWCVSKTGRYYTVPQKLNAGIRVLALRDGTPVLKWACGNPLTSKLPDAVSIRHSVAKRVDVPAEAVMGYTSTIANEGTPDVPLTHAITSTPVENNFSTPAFMVGGATELLVSPSVGGGTNPLALLPLGGLAALKSSGVTPKVPVPLTDTPEPAPILTLLVGIAGLGLLAYNRRRSNAVAAR